MKKELLAPVGSMDALYAAVHNGADAVYLAGKSFGARASAKNFSDDEIIEAIKFSHLYGVLVYVTVNTLISNDEFSSVMKFVDFLYLNGVDAIILQDIGLADLIHKTYPDLELHASTQMHNLDVHSAAFLKSLGFGRIVLARELSIDEINSIDTSLEIEAFIHGALCMSYSGQCLMSSMAVNRSGNKGACAQLCRMPYTSNNGSGYLLSPKDVSTVSMFDDVMKSNIYSLKIEGRMKSPAYVAVVTKMYRKLIDGFYDNKTVDINEDINNLNYLFNRGYSKGYIGSDNNIMNITRPNHKGVHIGDVIDVNESRITIKLIKSLHVGDGIKFEIQDKGLNVFNFYINNVQVKDAECGNVITIPNKIGLTDKDKVLKTLDVLLEDSVLNYELKKIKVDVDISALVNSQFVISITDGIHFVKEIGNVLEVATNKATTKEDVVEKVSKMGNTPFVVDNININIDENVFVPVSMINNLRRILTDKLIDLRTGNKIRESKKVTDVEFLENSRSGLIVYVRNDEQLSAIKNYNVDKIYTNNYELYSSNKDLNIYYEVNIGEKRTFDNDKLLINSTSDFIKYKDNDTDINYTMNIYNKYTANYFNNFDMTLSPELSFNELDGIQYGNRLIYGRVRVMMTRQCVLSMNCSNCRDKFLIDTFKNKYVIECINKVNYIYNYRNLDYIHELNNSINYECRIDFFDESAQLCKEILNRYFLRITK